MTPQDVEVQRKQLKLTQAQMAAEIGLSLRAYEDLIHCRTRWRKIHDQAATYTIRRLRNER